MTRKDYIKLAEALRFARAGNPDLNVPQAADYAGLVEHLIASALSKDNPRFNYEHFLAVVRGERDLQSRPKRKAA